MPAQGRHDEDYGVASGATLRYRAGMPLIWSFVDFVLMILQAAIFIQVILSWLLAFNVVNRSNQFVGGLYQGLDRVLEPIYRPVRRVLPDFGALDLSPLVILLLVSFLRSRAIPYLAYATTPGVA